MKEKSGLARIAAVFERAQAENRAALMPYFTLGYQRKRVNFHDLR